MLVIRLAISACKAAQLPHTHDSRARGTREACNKFAPDASAKTTTLSVRRHRELEGRARHAMCGWQGEIAQVWHVSHVHGHPARAAHAVEFLCGRATAAWSGGAPAENCIRNENEVDGEVRVKITAQCMGVLLLANRGSFCRVSSM